MRSIDNDQTVPLPQTAVEPQPTPSCYNLVVEGWLSEDDREEDEEEMAESHSIGEPWDWGEEKETRADQLRLRDEDDVVSPSLLVSQ